MTPAVLLTGATGYIGDRLLRHFEGAGRSVRCLARNPERVRVIRSTMEVVQGDCFDKESLDLARAGVDSAYYLVHSMSIGADFAEVDRQAAANFGCAAARAAVRHIIYLGGLADQTASLSRHLQSRAETGSVLRASRIRVMPPSRMGRAVADRTAVAFRKEKPVLPPAARSKGVAHR